MPYLRIQSNRDIPGPQAEKLLQQASRSIADQLNKLEDYVMVAMAPTVPMLFAGSNAPAVFMELKSIGLNESQTPKLSEALCKLVHEAFGVDQDRVYIEFADAPRKMWGWNGTTF